jgi:hypothetical protein
MSQEREKDGEILLRSEGRRKAVGILGMCVGCGQTGPVMMTVL